MSNVGQALTAIAGGVIGFIVSGFSPVGALYGLEIGLLAGTVLSPTQLPGTYGPKISDGNTTTASVGAAVNFGYGLFSVSGTVCYLGKLNELSTTTNQSQKGAPTQSQTTYSYNQTLAIGLCEGPITEVRRIWENGQLVYDPRPHQPDETGAAYSARVAANTKYAAGFVLYKGTETQLPDPTIEEDEGVGNVPAFRGLAYIMYPNRGLRDDQGQRHPTFKVEIYVGVLADYDATIPVDIASVIELICARCGYDVPNQIDASSVEGTTVEGYSIQAVMAGRDALVPLRSVAFFDCVESGLKLRFQKRGASPIRTLDNSDLGTYDDPSNADPDAAVSVSEQQDVELPKQVRVSYISADTDYEQGQQLSPQRYDTEAVNVIDVQLAVCMKDDQALQVAEVLWADAWSSRKTFTTAINQRNADLEPSDVVILPMLGTNYRARIVKINDSSQILRKATLISDDDGSYVSTATATPGTRGTQPLGVQSGSVIIFLDLPALQDEHDEAGFYAVAHGDGTGNAWSGAVVYKSTDGDVFNQVATLTNSPPIGNLLAPLNPISFDAAQVWDDETVISVQNIKGQYSSRDDGAVLAGANALAIGADGRWEIVQFGVATPVGDTSGGVFELTHLLRGRRGTEHNIGTSLTGDLVVGLTMGNLYRISLQNSEIGADRVYKLVTTNTNYTEGIDYHFIGNGVSLKPFSPVVITGKFVGSDLVINWVRRDRLNQTLQSGSTVPNSDPPEAYQIDIHGPGSPDVVRTLTSSTPTVTYTSSEITADFGSPPAHVAVSIYQISPIVGRGYPGEATIP